MTKNNLYGDKYQNKGIFYHIDKEIIKKWKKEDEKYIVEIENTINKIEKYFNIKNRLRLALKCGNFLIDDGYNEKNDTLWKGKGKKPITINEYKKLSIKEKLKAIPICPGDELQYFGAFGLNWATHNGIFMGTEDPNGFGKMIEIDSNIEPNLNHRIYSMVIMIASGYISGTVNGNRNLKNFSYNYNYVGTKSTPIENGPRRPLSLIKNDTPYSIKEILDRALESLKIKIWEYNIKTANCETFTRFIVSGKWEEKNFFYVRILDNLFDAYLKKYSNSDEITEIYKLLVFSYHKIDDIKTQEIIFKILKNINKKIFDDKNIKTDNVLNKLKEVGIDLIKDITNFKKYENIEILFDKVKIMIEDNKDNIIIQNTKISNKDKINRVKKELSERNNNKKKIKKKNEDKDKIKKNKILKIVENIFLNSSIGNKKSGGMVSKVENFEERVEKKIIEGEKQIEKAFDRVISNARKELAKTTFLLVFTFISSVYFSISINHKIFGSKTISLKKPE